MPVAGSLTGAGSIEVLDGDDLLGLGSGSAILIADDTESNRVAYEAALAPLGRDLVLVASGIDTLATLLDQDVALIVLDVQMPEMGGLETARMLRDRPRNKGTPIIFVTGMTWDSDVVREAYALGALDFISKPVEPEILRAKVRLYLQLQERTRDVQRQRSELRAARHELEAEKSQHTIDTATARRLEKLQEATAGLAQAKTPADVAEVAVRLGAEAVSANASAMWLVQPDGSMTVEGSHGVPAAYLALWQTLPPNVGHPFRRVLERREAIWVETAEEFERDAPEMIEAARAADRVWSFASLPLVHDGKPLGVLTFGYQGTHRFPEEERRFLVALARTCEQALERSRLYVAEAEARRRAEAESLRKDEFLAMLGHELRNPLASIVSALDVLKLRGVTFPREMSIVERQTNHLVRFVHDLVDVSRLTQGKISLARTSVSLADAIQHAVDAARPLIDRRHHEVVVSLGADVLVDADRDRLAQVLGNLLSNAARYTPEHGRIEIAVRGDAPFVEIEVRDNGIGIPAALLPNVFDAFVQGERDLDRRDGGLGVGLTIVRRLVELHGGSVTAHSDGPGAGATFTVRWPRAA